MQGPSGSVLEDEMGQSNITRAISDLADLFEFGHLQAETDPAAMLDEATREIITLREQVRAQQEEIGELRKSRDHAIESLEYLYKASSDHMLSIPSVDWFMERVARALRDLGSMIDLEREPGYREILLDTGPDPESHDTEPGKEDDSGEPVKCRFCDRDADATWDAHPCETGGHICDECLSARNETGMIHTVPCADCKKPTDPRETRCYKCYQAHCEGS
jgi:hypothetical protein